MAKLNAHIRNFCTFNFCHLSNWWKMFNSENFPIYGIVPKALSLWVYVHHEYRYIYAHQFWMEIVVILLPVDFICTMQLLYCAVWSLATWKFPIQLHSYPSFSSDYYTEIPTPLQIYTTLMIMVIHKYTCTNLATVANFMYSFLVSPEDFGNTSLLKVANRISHIYSYYNYI